MSLDDFDRVPLLFGPSPVHPLRRLSEHLGGEVEIWAKREDCNSGIAFGGNKVRKLEYLVADALAQGCDTLVSIGGVQSNHTRAVTGVANHLGLKAVTVQEHWVDWPDVVYDKVGNLQLTRIMGGDIRMDPAGFDIGIRDSWQRALSSVDEAGGTPYPIPAGASDHPLGGLGFANWVREVAVQERDLGITFDTVVVCTVTGSTHAGMVAGAALEGEGRRIVGIDASATVDRTRDQLTRIATRTAEMIGVDRHLTADDIELVDGYHAGTYGIPDAATLEAIRIAARLEGMLTDPVYEGKSMAGLIGMVRSGEIEPGSRVLYAHLGGQPALSAYAGCCRSRWKPGGSPAAGSPPHGSHGDHEAVDKPSQPRPPRHLRPVHRNAIPVSATSVGPMSSRCGHARESPPPAREIASSRRPGTGSGLRDSLIFQRPNV